MTIVNHDRRRVAANSLALLGAQLAGLAAQATSILLIARGLGPAGLGQFSFISLAVLVAWTFAEFGLDTMLVREAADPERAPGRLLSETVLARLPLALLAVLALWLLPLPLPGATDETALALRIYSLVLVVSTVAGAGEALVRARERMGFVAGINLTSGLLRVAGIAGALAFGAGIAGLAAVMVMARLAEATLYLAAAGRLGLRRRDLAVPPVAALRARLRRALPFAVAGICGIVQLHGDAFVLGFLLGDRSLGLYRAAKGILDSCRFLPNAAFGALYPAIARLGGGRPLLRPALAAIGLLGLAGALVLSLAAGPLVDLLYGDRYQASAPVLRLVIWTLVPLVANTLVAAHLFATGRAGKVAAVTAAGAVGTIGLNATLVPALRLDGAAYAPVVAELGMLLLYSPDLARIILPTSVRLPAALTWPSALLGGLALAGSLWFVLLPESFRRYAVRESFAGWLDDRTASLLSLGVSLGLFLVLTLAGRRPQSTRPPEGERERR